MIEQSNFWDVSLSRLSEELKTSPKGLTSAEAKKRFNLYGPNSLAKVSRFGPFLIFLRLFTNPLVLILLAASIISMILGDKINSIIIIIIVLISVFVDFFQEFQANRAVAMLKKQIATTTKVLRDGKIEKISPLKLVPGDIIMLNAGDVVPADARIIESKDLHAHESALTGESFPVDKAAGDLKGKNSSINDAHNCVFLGTNIQTGIATAMVVHTGRKTAFGDIAERLSERQPETEFDRGIKQFGMMISKITLILVVFVFLVNSLHHRVFMDSFLFAVALAVGLTPELLPVIIAATLAKGAKRMAQKKVIVKQLASMENFGSVEIICSDKTGTLTEGEITLDRHLNVHGKDSSSVMEYIYLNSFFETGIKSPLDDAVLKHRHPSIEDFSKIDEIPFDFNRRRLSVVVKQKDGQALVVAKGEAESMFDICKNVSLDGKVVSFGAEHRKIAEATLQNLSAEGYRVLGVAIKEMPMRESYTEAVEAEMVFMGFAAFLDPPKQGISETIKLLKNDGISITIMTGDNQYVTQKIAQDVGLPTDLVLIGEDVDKMSDEILAQKAEQGAIFARVSPEQKNRVIIALKNRGRVVAFLGDGINDAPSLHAADVGISVANGVDVAKEAANIILLEKDLKVLNDGVLEGRRSFANIMKYIVMGTSSNFGNMFSMAAASLFLPFLPMLPTQILANNLLYDISQTSIPTDKVDRQLLRSPKRWKVDFIKQFMYIIGPLSSIYDFLTFGILIYWFHTNEVLFHTGWFVESLVTQTFVVFVIRTAGSPFKSKPSRELIVAVFGIAGIAIILPYLPFASLLGFAPLPFALLLVIILLTATYLALVHLVKTWFYKKHSLV